MTSEVGEVGVLAEPAVGAKKVAVRVLKVPVGSGVAIARLRIFAVLARPTLIQMPRITAIACVGCFTVIVEALETRPTVEAVGVSTLDSWYLAVVAEPAVGTGL